MKREEARKRAWLSPGENKTIEIPLPEEAFTVLSVSMGC